MIIGKIMMVQNSSPVGSVDYLISKKILELKGKITDYTLNQFIEEIGISKTSMMRYLKHLQIHQFRRFKQIMYNEYMNTLVDLKKDKESPHNELTVEVKKVLNEVLKCHRIIILGDGNRFSLLLYQKALIYLGIPCEIPVYLGSEEECISEYECHTNDLIIIVSLHETFTDFLTNRTLFYHDPQYLLVKTNAKIGFVGLCDTQDNPELCFSYAISKESFDIRVAQLQKLFLDVCCGVSKNSDAI